MKQDNKFTKYQQRGDYHQQQLKPHLFNFNAYAFLRYHQVLKLIPKRKNIKLLDIGCGEGTLLTLIRQLTQAQLFGIDPQAGKFSFPPDIKIIKATACQLPFKNNFFDYVISTEVIEHLSKPEKMLAEICRVLKPEATAIITTPVRLTAVPEDKLHLKEYSRFEFQQLLNKYFKQVIIKTSHPRLLKKLYTTTIFKLGRYHFDLFRWLINALALLIRLNLFALPAKYPSQQLAVLKQPKK